MLIEFCVENFISIKNKLCLSMEATKYRTDNLSNDFNIGTLNLLKTAVIFGPNASGKSNILIAMAKMRDIIELESKDKLKITPFKFDAEYQEKPTFFEVRFLLNEIIYRYGFKIKNQIITEEWLYHRKNKPRARENIYFKRNYQNFENFSDFKKEADLIKKENKTREDRLYLSIVAEFNGEISRGIMNWFEMFNSFSSINSQS